LDDFICRKVVIVVLVKVRRHICMCYLDSC
jgi:hypothetical protein